ncbi:MAG: caspase family protein [Alphaproteobacteria bacterium]|nr:caspase family protein [Alphaproteobacteria bacterium]
MRLVCLVLIFAFSAGAAAAERVALVMGNGNYIHTDPLQNAVNDATDIATALRSIGFRVFEGVDLSRREALLLIQDFSQVLSLTDTALFFFAGHATQIGTDNYIMPVDVQPGSEEELVGSSIRMQSILSTLENRAGTRIVILDACRNNPFVQNPGASRSADASRGLFKMDAGIGSFIAYSTEPGNVAADGTGRNSPFTTALLKHISEPQDIHAIMRSVRADVIEASGRRQIPWENSALIDEVFLAAVPPQSKEDSWRPAQSLSRDERAGETCHPIQIRGGSASFCASSVLSPQSGNRYGAKNLFDNNPATAWVEGQSDDGIGEYLAIDFDDPRDVRAIDLLNGYTKSERLFFRNGRVRTLHVTGSNGTRVDVTLRDDGSWQRIELDGFDDVSWLRLEVGSVYSGSHYTDTAISELRFQ